MKRQILVASTLALAAVLPACQSAAPNLQALSARSGIQAPAQFQSFNASTRGADWYSSLSPQLQQYYAPARGKSGLELFKTLSQIISQNHRAMGYQDAKSYMYAAVDQVPAPQRRGATAGVLDHYSYIFIAGQGGNGNIYLENGDENRDGLAKDFINCEHTWPQSFFNKVDPMVSDLHHMFPTLSKPNAMRSNYPFGMSTGRQVVYSTATGSKLAVIDKTGKMAPQEIVRIMNLPYEQQPHDVIKNNFDIVFEPLNAQKGNTARAMMYFYLRYYNQNIRAGAFDQKTFWTSKVPMFIEWAEKVDPIDAQEQHRHELAFQKQGNRNPFIDIPNLASIIGPAVFQNI
jgi:endonuclease I